MDSTTRNPNEILCQQRLLRGWSQQRVGELIGTSAVVVSRWESGRKSTSPFYQEKLCELFGKNAEELGFISVPSNSEDSLKPLVELSGEQEQLPARDVHGKPSIEDKAQSLRDDSELTADLQNATRSFFSQAVTEGILNAARELVGDDMNHLRRQILQQVLTAVGITLLVSPDHFIVATEQNDLSRASDSSSLRCYEALLSFSWEHYYARGSQNLLAIVDDCLHSLTERIPMAHSSEQQYLISLLCRFYQLSGVIARDQMNLSCALSHGKKAIELAFSTENAELIAASLFRRAKTHIKHKKFYPAVQDLEASLIYAQRVRNPLKGYVHQALAEAYTITAEPHDQHMQQKSLALLDTVSTIIENGNLEDDGSFVQLNVVGLSMDRANVLTHYRNPAEARQNLNVAQQRLGVDLNRWKTRLLIAQAEISLAENDVYSSSKFLLEALQSAQITHSRSQEKRVAVVYQQLRTVAPNTSLVRQLEEQLQEH